MKKITFEEWKNNYKDIPFLEKNFPEMEDHGVDVAQIKEKNQSNIIDNPNQCVTKTVRVFLYGGYYELDHDGFYHLVLENRSWAEETTDIIDKELFEWCDGEYFNTEEYCVECGCDLTHRDDGDDKCCWCIERIQKEKNNDPYGLESVTDNDYDENGNWRHE